MANPNVKPPFTGMGPLENQEFKWQWINDASLEEFVNKVFAMSMEKWISFDAECFYLGNILATPHAVNTLKLKGGPLWWPMHKYQPFSPHEGKPPRPFLPAPVEQVVIDAHMRKARDEGGPHFTNDCFTQLVRYSDTQVIEWLIEGLEEMGVPDAEDFQRCYNQYLIYGKTEEE